MAPDSLYQQLKLEKPALLYISGKTCVGKTTFANRLRENLGYEIIELDKIVVESVIKPQGLTDAGVVFVEVYRNDEKRQLIDPFVAATKQVILTKQAQHQPIVIEGAVANTNTLAEIFRSDPGFMFIYFHPQNLDVYKRNLTSRFMLAGKGSSSGLPKRFWALIDEKEFGLFCHSRIITPKLEHSIAEFALSSQQESKHRFSTFKERFDQIIVVEV